MVLSAARAPDFPGRSIFWRKRPVWTASSPRLFRSHVMTEWDHAASRRVDHVIGAFYLIRREVFEKLGGFDGRFFLYLEDLDLSCRVCGHGRHIMYLADARAYHKGGGVSEQAKAAQAVLFREEQDTLRLQALRPFCPRLCCSRSAC